MADLMYAILYRENIDDYTLDNLLSILALKGIRISEKVFRREIENFELIEVDRDKKVYIGGRFNG
jgi:hypothetical protein